METKDGKKKRGRPVKKNIDPEKVGELLRRGLSKTQVARALKCTPQTVNYLTQTYDLEPEKVESFKKLRADLLADKQRRILDHLTEAKLEKAGLRDLSLTFGILFDKERLERGKSTSNLSLFSVALQQAGDWREPKGTPPEKGEK